MDESRVRREHWLVTRCAGERLSVAGPEELAALEGLVSAELRERVVGADARGWFNRSWASRLPPWLKAAKNRAAILAGLRRLRAKVPAWASELAATPVRRSRETSRLGVSAGRARRKHG